MNNNRASNLLKNTFLFFIASFGTKFISFFLTPLYTSLIPTDAYGTIDLLGTIVSLVLPVLMVDISDAIMFFSFQAQDEEEKIQPLLFGMRILRISGILLAVSSVIVGFIFHNNQMWIYCLYICLLFFNQAFRLNILAYMRSINMVNAIVTSGICSSVVMLVMNVALLLWLRLGIYGLMISTILGEVTNNAYCLIATKYWKLKKTPYTVTKEQKRKMIQYSFPLIFTGIAWWINSSLDRFFIVSMCGIDTNGIYAVANRIPSILTAVHSVIYQAMQLSVFSQMKTSDSKQYMKKLYSIYNFVMVISGSLLILLNKPLSGLLFKSDYYIAWKYTPALLISTILYSVAGYTTIIAAASSETKLITIGTLSGAAVNTILNILLIPYIGLYGAVIATTVGYFVLWLVLLLKLESHLKINFPKLQSMIMYLLLCCQWILSLFIKRDLILNAVIMLIICAINFQCIKDLWNIGISLLQKLKLKLKTKN